MRVSIVGATFLLVGAGAAAVGATDTTGDGLNLNGSDTLFKVTQQVLSSCGSDSAPAGDTAAYLSFTHAQFNGHGLSYLGGGSGVGAGQMDLGAQKISPMSRGINASEYCNASTGLTLQDNAESLMVGLDGIAIMVNTTSSGSSSAINGVANGGTLAVTDRTGTAVTNCVGCASGTSNYTFNDSLDVLKVVYGGLHHDTAGTFDCGGAVRKSLVANWSKLFAASPGTSACTTAGALKATDANGNLFTIMQKDASGTTALPVQLTHAWRRSDLSGTTDAFVTLVGFGARKIGTLPTAPGPGKSTKVNPFCNTADANTNVASFAGSGDYSDLDPIRVPCGDNDTVCEGNTDNSGHGVLNANVNGTLGLVLPILLPDVATLTHADSYFLDPAHLTNPSVVCSPGKFDLVDDNDSTVACPGGPLLLGKCFTPYHLNSDGTHNYSCYIDDPGASAFGTVNGTDARGWNLPLRKPDTIDTPNLPAAFAVDGNNNNIYRAFFRIHMLTPAAWGGTGTCTNDDDTQQIGCLVNSDICSIGYAGREADQVGGNSALAVKGILPTDANIKLLLTNPTADYPLSRRLYFSTIYGFANLAGGEKLLSQCYADNLIVKAAMTANNFVALDSPGIACLNYDVTASTTATPLNGCGLTGVTDHNACNDHPGLISNSF